MQAANFTMPLWAWNSDVSQLGPAPGAPWGRWIDYQSQNDLTASEQPYKPNLIQLQVGDEQDIVNDPAVRAATTAWFNDNRAKFPATLLYLNRPAGDGSASEATSTANFIAQAQPDMLTFDWYPFNYNPTFDPSFPNRRWNWYWYSVAQRYRRQALGSSIGATFGTAGNAPRPYGTYLQTYFTAPAPDEDKRPPSDSENAPSDVRGADHGLHRHQLLHLQLRLLDAVQSSQQPATTPRDPAITSSRKRATGAQPRAGARAADQQGRRHTLFRRQELIRRHQPAAAGFQGLGGGLRGRPLHHIHQRHQPGHH
jgi:hypothetical protein